MADTRVFTLSQVAQHKSMKDCWLVIDGRVLNVTELLEEHPGGEEVVIESAGKDATKEFKDIGHSKGAQNMIINYQVGVLSGYTFTDTDKNDVSINESTHKEMTAFVIKDSGIPNHVAFLQFFVPLSLSVSYFLYNYLTRVAIHA
ncbi:cytochrome B5-like [Euphorbia lathyris]|uniref:cytochrome B5-like n=1 Tax=Euphorbia lathyris TaxID=212925 RepID=UPI0033144B00